MHTMWGGYLKDIPKPHVRYLPGHGKAEGSLPVDILDRLWTRRQTLASLHQSGAQLHLER